MVRMAAIMLASGFLLGCGSRSAASSEAGLVIVNIRGKAEAFENRTIFVQHVEAGKAGLTGDDEYPFGVSVGVCSRDKEILHGPPIRIRVFEAGTLLAESVLELEACRLSEDPGNIDESSLILELDGRVITALGEDPRISSTCMEMPVVCDADSLAP